MRQFLPHLLLPQCYIAIWRLEGWYVRLFHVIITSYCYGRLSRYKYPWPVLWARIDVISSQSTRFTSPTVFSSQVSLPTVSRPLHWWSQRFQIHNLYEMDKTAAAAVVNAVSVKLPTFWREQPELWFAQAESQFRLRGVTDENTKFDHVITSLDVITEANVSDLIRNRPTTTPYTCSRLRLAYVYELSDRDRACRLLDIGHLGDQKPSEVLNKMLNLVEKWDTNFLIHELFLRTLPREVRAIVASS